MKARFFDDCLKRVSATKANTKISPLKCDHTQILHGHGSIQVYKVALTFESVDEILWCDHLNESYWAVLSCGTVYYAVQGGSNFWVC